MINLLPPEGKKGVLKNYWLRVVSIYFILCGTAFFITGALLLPTYFYILYQTQALGTVIVEEDVVSLKQIETDINTANQISTLLVSTPTTVRDSDILTEVLAFSDGLAEIGSINIKKDGRKISEIVVNGVAYDRSTLVAFRDRAEQHQFFKEVNLPLSNLAKDQNISFSLTLEPSDELTQDL